jgi:hypothetical protein
MNRVHLIQFLSAGLLILMTACQAAGQSVNMAFRPGDTIDGMGLTTGAADAPSLLAFCSGSRGSDHMQTFDCRAPVLPALAIGHLFLLTDEAFANLGWSDLVWELSINGQPVDLESFGTFDYVMPSMAKSPSPVREVFEKATAWNIVLTNLNPGEHTLRFQAHNDTQSYSWFVNLAVDGADGTDISSMPFPLHS